MIILSEYSYSLFSHVVMLHIYSLVKLGAHRHLTRGPKREGNVCSHADWWCFRLEKVLRMTFKLTLVDKVKLYNPVL